MNSELAEEKVNHTYWLVGAAYGGSQDQTPRFLSEGIWENGYSDKYIGLVKSMQPGDPIAIKATFVRKKDLPFDNRGHNVSVMAIKATGIITENPGDGQTVKVDWTPIDPPREYYFGTYRKTVWRMVPGEPWRDDLIGCVFYGKTQNFDLYVNDPYWRERFGNIQEANRFEWTTFYETVADRLLAYRDRRDELLAGLHEIASRVDGVTPLNDQFADGTHGPLRDICPFTAMGVFNRSISDKKRTAIAQEMAAFLGIDIPAPTSFGGIPSLNNQKSWFFAYAETRQPEDIDKLWDVFETGLRYADGGEAETREAFVQAHDAARTVVNVGWNLTMGLYWARPWFYPTLDGQSRNYITTRLKLQVATNGPKKYSSAEDYLTLQENLDSRFKEELFPVHSYPELSFTAWHFEKPEGGVPQELALVDAAEDADEGQAPASPVPLEPYTTDDIIREGSFQPRERLEGMLSRLHLKKNIILQGPPGTGKTWLARRLAYALMGERNETRLRAVQFHPNLTYEDFVRGWRPSGAGTLSLVDGPFVEMIGAALADPDSAHVLVIEEINRGNPAQIFGEMLTLLEADKRTPSEALELSYRRAAGELVYIPSNLYVVGTMNIADRSLALVDLALRRRFAFIDLEPTLGSAWRNWVSTKFGIDGTLLEDIEARVTQLNTELAADASLGKQFQVGHSYVTPPQGAELGDPRAWFVQVVQTEIGPLLDEYWFDAPLKAEQAKARLLEGF